MNFIDYQQAAGEAAMEVRLLQRELQAANARIMELERQLGKDDSGDTDS
jgi:hypothetical protein